MVHGILGSPVQFEFVAKRLQGYGFTVMAVLLPGHGGSAKDFARSNVGRWQQEVRQAVSFLRQRYERFFIIGHSMGGLLAINEAVVNGAAGLILMATPMKVKIFSTKALHMSLRVLFGDPKKDDEMLRSYRKANSVQKGTITTYFSWAPRFLDLLTLIRKTRQSLTRVRCPVLIIQSRCDEAVSWKSQRVLTTELSSALVEELLLEKSRHSHFHSDEVESMYERICRFVVEKP
jgi:carboxylesterase